MILTRRGVSGTDFANMRQDPAGTAGTTGKNKVL